MSDNTQKILTVTAIGVGIYVAARVVGLFDDVRKGLTDVGSAIGSGLYEFFHKDAAGEPMHYTVRFADGYHAVPSRSVNKDGFFTWTDGKRYRIMVMKVPDPKFPTRNKIAVAA